MMGQLLIVGGLWLILTGKKTDRMIPVDAKGEQLTKGYVDKGRPIQPTYQQVEVRVRAQKSKVCATKTITKKIGYDRDRKLKTDRISYSLLYFYEDDDGRRTYSYRDTAGVEKQKTSKVVGSVVKGFMIARKDNLIRNKYAPLGRRDLVQTMHTTQLGTTEEEAKAVFDQKMKELEAYEPKPPADPTPDPPPFLPPSPFPDGAPAEPMPPAGDGDSDPAPLDPPQDDEEPTFPELPPDFNPPAGGGLGGANVGGGMNWTGVRYG